MPSDTRRDPVEAAARAIRLFTETKTPEAWRHISSPYDAMARACLRAAVEALPEAEFVLASGEPSPMTRAALLRAFGLEPNT